MDINISLIPYADWKGIIHDVIAVRTSAYLDWNGPRTGAEQESEAGFWLERWALRRDATLFAARQNGQMVGYLLADERERSEYYLSHMGVHGDFKGQGIGRALIRRYEKEARDRFGCRNGSANESRNAGRKSRAICNRKQGRGHTNGHNRRHAPRHVGQQFPGQKICRCKVAA